MTSQDKMKTISNGRAIETSAIPVVGVSEFGRIVCDSVKDGGRLSALFVAPREGSGRSLLAVIAKTGGDIALVFCSIGDSYPSLTLDCPQAHWFEREIFERHGVTPQGHPWLKPIRFSNPSSGNTIGVTDFYSMKGDEVHEVAVGPVHAGVIEPGHFRFQCHGETVHHLEISLGYQHRGIERALVGGPNLRTIHYVETAAGDTSIGHATAYAMAMEALMGIKPTPRAEAIRAIAAELERLANHVGDLGALAGDVGFLPTLNYCGRIRGDALNMTALICGNRFGRGLVVPGGAAWDMDEGIVSKLLSRLDEFEADTKNAVNLMFESPSVLARFEGTGVVTTETAAAIGLVGVAARASGLDMDVRCDFSYGAYTGSDMQIAEQDSGDVFARAMIRRIEIENSIAFIRRLARSLPGGDVYRKSGAVAKNMIAVSMTEGWRGEICHVAITSDDGRFTSYKIVDSSFHNWFGLAMSLRDQQISDFPLCNKSFNLSYCGHDL